MPILGPPFVGVGEAPRVVEVVAETRTRVRVRFSEAMRADATLLDPTSYTLTPDVGSVSRTITRVTPSARVGPTSVILAFSAPLTVGADNYRLDVDNAVEDAAGNALDPAADGDDFSVPAAATTTIGQAERLVVLARIEGIGAMHPSGAAVQYTWCSRRPRLYTDYDDGIYVPDLAEWPSQVEQRLSPLGGVAESGELTVVIVDGGAAGDRLTQLLAIHRRAVSRFATAVARDDTEVTFAAGASVTAGTIVWAGGEAIRVGALVSGTTYGVTRGALDTDPQRHTSGAAVLLGTPLLMGRRMRLFVGANDGAHASTDEEEIESGWAIDQVELTPDLGAWVLRGRSQLKYLDRLVDRMPFQAAIQSYGPSHESLVLRPLTGDFNAYRQHFGDRVFIRIGDDEIAQMTPDGVISTQPVAGTRKGEWRDGDTIRQVFVARSVAGSSFGSFRYQAPGAETSSRATGTWVPSDHAVVILLCIITGKSDLDDNTPDNYSAGSGNYSALPPGVGLGMPAGEIDVGSFLDVWHRAPHLTLEHFVLDATETGREVIDRILRLTGIELKTVAGLLMCDYQRTPLADDIVAAWDVASMVARDDGEGNLRPTITSRLDGSLAIGAVTFKCRNRRGDEVSVTYSDANFSEVLGDVRGLYTLDEKPLEIDARAVRVDDQGGDPELLRLRAFQVLRNYRRIPWRHTLSTPRDQRHVQVGDQVHITYPQLPDLLRGQRGVVNQLGKVTSKREVIDRDRVEIEWGVVSLPETRAGRIAPTARISGAATGNVIPVTANRYTDPAARAGLPSTDADAFRVGDRVRLTTRGGLTIATTPPYQTVVAIGTNTLELDGDFGGSASVAAGTLINYVAHADATQAQREAFVFLSDDATRTVGASDETAWQYGEG